MVSTKYATQVGELTMYQLDLVLYFSLQCSRTCGLGGIQTRDVFCVNRFTFDQIDEDFCNIQSITRPNDVQECFIDNCPGKQFVYVCNTVYMA